MIAVDGQPGQDTAGDGQKILGQTEMPFAIVQGTPLVELPKDLHIPPDALEVILDAFEGPLDLLLYLIRKQNLDILDIPIARITEQYTQYIELMEETRMELAGEYLLMAAMLTEIKSRMLLPQPELEEEDEEDPRAELVRRLQEYERFRDAAGKLDALPRYERDVFAVMMAFPDRIRHVRMPEVDLDTVLSAFADVLRRVENQAQGHSILREPLTVRERMAGVLDRAGADAYVRFSDLFVVEEGRAGVIVTLLAVLELMREALLELRQDDADGSLYVKAAA